PNSRSRKRAPADVLSREHYAEILGIIEEQARWRGRIAEEFPGDVRNRRTAESLQSILLPWFKAQPANSSLNRRLEKVLVALEGLGAEQQIDVQTEIQQTIARFDYDHLEQHADPKRFIEYLVVSLENSVRSSVRA